MGIKKTILRPVVNFVAEGLAPVLAPIFSRVARSGLGSNACLRWGFLPLPVDFYSPVPDLADLERRKVWDRQSDLGGINFRPDTQVDFLAKLGREFGSECDWLPNPTRKNDQFYTENGSFSYGCAAGAHCIIRHFKPGRVIEIGSGNSSLVIANALALNAEKAGKEKAEYIIVDPFPGRVVDNGFPDITKLMKCSVESLDVSFFDQLTKNDVLFIDSGHTVRIGGDVNYLVLDVLPRLAPGVIVHFHDIGLPNEYAKKYATNPRFRVFWTEAYLLQAFLCFNREFEILMAMEYLMTEQNETFRKAFLHFDPSKHVSLSGSFWIRRK